MHTKDKDNVTVVENRAVIYVDSVGYKFPDEIKKVKVECNRVYVDGYEYRSGRWKKTFRAFVRRFL